MFGIGLPEMIVILAVALIVVGPDKLPDMARSVAKWVFELKKTVNQVKESLADEENLIDSVQSDLRKTGNDLKGKLLESDHFTFHEPGTPLNVDVEKDDEIIDIDEQQEAELHQGEGEEKEPEVNDPYDGVSEQESEPPEKPSP